MLGEAGPSLPSCRASHSACHGRHAAPAFLSAAARVATFVGMNAELPTVAGANLLGHAHLFRKDRLALLRAVAEAGPITRLRFFHKPVLFVSSPEMAHQVLVERARSFEKSPALKILFHDLAGEGLFTSEGPLWQRQRRLMSPLFHAEEIG